MLDNMDTPIGIDSVNHQRCDVKRIGREAPGGSKAALNVREAQAKRLALVRDVGEEPRFQFSAG